MNRMPPVIQMNETVQRIEQELIACHTLLSSTARDQAIAAAQHQLTALIPEAVALQAEIAIAHQKSACLVDQAEHLDPLAADGKDYSELVAEVAAFQADMTAVHSKLQEFNTKLVAVLNGLMDARKTQLVEHDGERLRSRVEEAEDAILSMTIADDVDGLL